MNQIIKILKEKIIEVSKASQQNNKEYNEEYEKVLRNLDRNHEVVELEKNLADNEQKLTTTQNYLQQSLTARATTINDFEHKKNEIQQTFKLKPDEMNEGAKGLIDMIINAK